MMFQERDEGVGQVDCAVGSPGRVDDDSQQFQTRVPGHWLPLRLLGVGATRLVRDEQVQHDLFSQAWRGRQQALAGAVDAIRDQFGRAAIRRARQLDTPSQD